MVEGILFYVVGASGSGKDTLIEYARKRLEADSRVIFAHRYITRPPQVDGENHVALSEPEFTARLAKGLFALHWESHGLRYAVGAEINFWLAKNFHVVMNGSRAYLEEARSRYPELEVVYVEASPALLRRRLRNRKREIEEDIAARLARASLFSPDGRRDSVIRNDGSIEEGGEALVALIEGRSGARRCA